MNDDAIEVASVKKTDMNVDATGTADFNAAADTAFDADYDAAACVPEDVQSGDQSNKAKNSHFLDCLWSQ